MRRPILFYWFKNEPVNSPHRPSRVNVPHWLTHWLHPVHIENTEVAIFGPQVSDPLQPRF